MEKYYHRIHQIDSIKYFSIGLLEVLCMIIIQGPAKASMKYPQFGYILGGMGILLIFLGIKNFFKKNHLELIENYAQSHHLSMAEIEKDFSCAIKYDARVRMGKQFIFYLDDRARAAVVKRLLINQAEFEPSSTRSLYGTLHLWTTEKEHYEIPIKSKGAMRIKIALFGF